MTSKTTTCTRCHRAITDEEIALHWPVQTEGGAICPDCYGDEAYCACGALLDATDDTSTCPECASSDDPDGWRTLPCGGAVLVEGGEPVRLSDGATAETEDSERPDGALILQEASELLGYPVEIVGEWQGAQGEPDATATCRRVEDESHRCQSAEVLGGDGCDSEPGACVRVWYVRIQDRDAAAQVQPRGAGYWREAWLCPDCLESVEDDEWIEVATTTTTTAAYTTRYHGAPCAPGGEAGDSVGSLADADLLARRTLHHGQRLSVYDSAGAEVARWACTAGEVDRVEI